MIATEDIRFYEHSGIDYWGTVGGVVSTLLGDKRGASTISQQLALNLFSSREKSVEANDSEIKGVDYCG